MRRKGVWCFALLVMITAIGAAQTTLTLDRCLLLAQKNSPTLRASEGAVHSSELAASELSSTALPQVKAVAGGTYAPEPPKFGYDPAISNGGQVEAQVVLQQSLYDGGIRSLKSDQLQFGAELLQKERKRTLRDLIFAVKQTFIEALRAQAEVQLQSQSVQQLADYRDIVQRLYNGGNAGYGDVLKTEVQLSTVTISLGQANESLASARYSLAGLIGDTTDSSVILSGSLDSLAVIVPDTSAATWPGGFVENLDLGIAGLGIKRSLLDVELARRERLPVVSLFGDAGYLSSLENLRLPGGDRLSGFGYSIGLGVEIPILNWGATGLRIEQREIEATSLQFQWEALRRSLRTDFQKTRLQLSRAKDRLIALRANRDKAEQNYLLTKSRYAGGAALSLEVLSAQQLLTETKLAELQTLADIQLLASKLEQLKAQ